MEEKKELIRLFIADYAMGVRDAIRLARRNMDLRERMMNEVVTFCFKKSDGSERIAMGTLIAEMMPETKGNGKPMKQDLQLYFDIEKKSFRCFKKANLLRIGK